MARALPTRDTSALAAELARMAANGATVEQPKLLTLRQSVKRLGMGKVCKCGAITGDRKDPYCSACRAIYMSKYRKRGRAVS